MQILCICMAFKINPNYYRADVLKKLYDLRAAGETFHAIGIKLNEEYGFKMTDPTVKSLYLKYVAKNLLVQNTKEIAQEQRVAGEIVPDYQKKMEERFDKIAKITDDLMDTLTEMKDNMEPEVYVKTIPTILMVAREILNQLNYIKKRAKPSLSQSKEYHLFAFTNYADSQ